MDLYIFCVVLGAAGMAAMAFLGFANSHGGGGAHHGHDTSGHTLHGVGGSHSVGAGHGHSAVAPHGVAHGPSHHAEHEIGGKAHNVTPYPIVSGHGQIVPSVRVGGWRSHVWSWLSPRVLFNVLVGFGATGLIVERLVGPVLALPIALIGGIAFESLVVRPIFNSLFRFESAPAQTLESSIMSEARAVTGFDVNGNGLISLELGGEVVQILGTLTREELKAGVRVRAGDSVRVEEVDSVRNRCLVSRIGLGEA
jgi:hypothetical protein